MQRTILSTVALILAVLTLVGMGAAGGADLVAPTPPRTPDEEQKGFHLPPGFEIQLVASEPDIAKPMNLAFDDRGRLWVTESVEYPFPAPPARPARDRVKILEDTDGDGRADKVTTFADGLNIPIGILPITGGALVHSIPNIYHYRAANGGDHADQHEVLYGSIGSNDTHGMTNAFTWGFDGWIYACHGFANSSTVKAADGSTITMQSGNIYRMRADGSRVEQFTHGQVNPFGLCFDPLGNLYSADCHTRPVMMLLRGGYYPSFGKPHDGLGFAPEICRHDHGSTGIAGIAYYAADQFPPAYRDTLFVGNVVTSRINHDRLERHGSTLNAVLQPDFLTSDDPWFRPVDIKLGPDGALYVADFYNRIIGHYEVPLTHPGRDRESGRIWRIVYRGQDTKGTTAQPRTDWTRATVPELIEDLAHPNLTVRIKAANQLVERGGAPGNAAIRAILSSGSSPLQSLHGLWILERQGSLDDATLTRAAQDPDASVRVHAQRVLANRVRLSASQRTLAESGLKDPDAFVQRAAAEALGFHAAPENLRPLLDRRHAVSGDDSQLLYGVRMALRNQLLPSATWAHLPTVSRGEADARALADVAPGVPTAEAAAFLLQHIQRWAEGTSNLRRYVHHIARYGSGEAETPLLAFVRSHRPGDLKTQVALATEIQRGSQERGSKLSNDAARWCEELTDKLLAAADEVLILAGISLAQAQQMKQMQPRLMALATENARSEPQRTAALAALVTMDATKHLGLVGQILGDASESLAQRQQMANVLARTNRAEARAELLRTLSSAPARLATVIAIGLAGSRQGGEALLEAVKAGKASPRLLQERIVVLRLEGAKLPNLKDRLAQLTLGLPSASQDLQSMLQRKRSGFTAARADTEIGAKLFEKNCAVCHQLGGKGAKVGPQLDGIGARGIDRLLEDLLDPNRNVDQAFRATALELKNGQLVSGLVLREEGEVVVLADAQGKEVRVPKSSIQERTVSPISPMPANLLDQVSEPELYHLLAYLLAHRLPAAAGPLRPSDALPKPR